MSDEDASEEPQDEDDEFEITSLRPDHHEEVPAESAGPDSVPPPDLDAQTQRRTLRSVSIIVLLAILAISLPPTHGALAGLPGILSPTPQEQVVTSSQIVVVSGGISTSSGQAPDLPPPIGGVTVPGPAPTNCWSERPPVLSNAVSGLLGRAIGGGPLWVSGFSGPPPTLSLAYAGQPQTTLSPFGWTLHDTEFGWPVPINLVVPAGNHEPLGLTGSDAATGQQLLFGLVAPGDSGPPNAIMPAITLDPQNPRVPAAGASSAGTSYWDGYVFLPGAGCYVLHGGAGGDGWTLTVSTGS